MSVPPLPPPRLETKYSVSWSQLKCPCPSNEAELTGAGKFKGVLKSSCAKDGTASPSAMIDAKIAEPKKVFDKPVFVTFLEKGMAKDPPV